MYGLAFDDTPLREVLTVQEGGEESPEESLKARLLNRHFEVLREQLRVMDCVAREVWQAQGEAITPHFVREMLVPKATNLIDAWSSPVQPRLDSARRPGSFSGLFRQVAVVDVPKLRRRLNTRYEMEAQT